jgi:ribosome-associated translation inhibitor RaiA
MMAEEYTDFPIELHVENDLGDDQEKTLYIEAEERLRKLAKNHTDITGASVDIKQPAQERETPYIYEATVTVYMRPNNIAATEKDSDVEVALRGALKATERQVRDKREQLRNY